MCYIFHEYVLPRTHDQLTIQLHYQWIKTVELDLTLIRKNEQLPHKQCLGVKLYCTIFQKKNTLKTHLCYLLFFILLFLRWK